MIDGVTMRDFMDRRVTPPKRVTSFTSGTTPPCKQALTTRQLTWLCLSLGDSYSSTEAEYTLSAFNSLDMTGKVRFSTKLLGM